MSKANSIFKKVSSLKSTGIEPVLIGKENYRLNLPEIEAKAKERSLICSNCESAVEEPISWLKVKDERITELNNKICDNCGCALPYLLRQNEKICKLW